jgi:beta-glucosidase
MQLENLSQSAPSAPISRRELIAVSVASFMAMAISPRAFPDNTTETSSGISDSAFEDAQRRAASLVSRMTLEEVIGQVVNDAQGIPRFGLPRYAYWSEALHGVNVDGPITSFPQPIALGCSWNYNLVYKLYTGVRVHNERI